MKAIEVVALVASVTSLVVSVIAIWLALTLYRMAGEAREKEEDASRRVGSAVEGLQQVVERLEVEVPDPQMIEDRMHAEIAQLRLEVHGELSSIAEKVARSDQMVHELGQEVDSLMRGRGTGAATGPGHAR